jgi:hypothetical protein
LKGGQVLVVKVSSEEVSRTYCTSHFSRPAIAIHLVVLPVFLLALFPTIRDHAAPLASLRLLRLAALFAIARKRQSGVFYDTLISVDAAECREQPAPDITNLMNKPSCTGVCASFRVEDVSGEEVCRQFRHVEDAR